MKPDLGSNREVDVPKLPVTTDPFSIPSKSFNAQEQNNRRFWMQQSFHYFLSSASRIPIVLSLARNVDSLILWDIAQSLIDIRMPLCSTPQFPQDDVWPLCRLSNRTSTSLPHKHLHKNLRLPVDATSLTTVNSPYFFPFPITIGRNLLSLRLGFRGTFLR